MTSRYVLRHMDILTLNNNIFDWTLKYSEMDLRMNNLLVNYLLYIRTECSGMCAESDKLHRMKKTSGLAVVVATDMSIPNMRSNQKFRINKDKLDQRVLSNLIYFLFRIYRNNKQRV